MIASVIINLLNNGLQFSDFGGEIFLKVTSEGDYYKVAIEDNGLAMTTEQLDQVFVPMEKKATTSGTYGEIGSGVGLALCRDFVVQNGGEVFVTWELKKGTLFTFIIPKYKEG